MPRALAPARDGGWLITGDQLLHPVRYQPTPAWLARISSDGTLTWLHHYPGVRGNWWSLVPDGAGGAYLLGDTVARADGDGRLLWVREVSATQVRWRVPALLDREGRLVYVSNGSGDTIDLVRLDADGTVLAADRYRKPAGLRGHPKAMAEFGDGYAILVDQVLYGREEIAAWLLVVRADGAPRWSRELRGSNAQQPLGFSALAPLGDGLLVAGGIGDGTYAWGDEATLLLHFGPAGGLCWQRSVAGQPSIRAHAVRWPDGAITLVGDSGRETIDFMEIDATGTPGSLASFSVGTILERFDAGKPRVQAAAANHGALAVVAADTVRDGFLPLLLQLGSDGEGPAGTPVERRAIAYGEAHVESQWAYVYASEAEVTSHALPLVEPVPQARFTFDPRGPFRLLAVQPDYGGTRLRSVPEGIDTGSPVAIFPPGSRVQLLGPDDRPVEMDWGHEPWFRFAEPVDCSSDMVLDGDAWCRVVRW